MPSAVVPDEIGTLVVVGGADMISVVVRHTLVRGRFVLRDHELIADAVGSGRFVTRHAA